MKGTYCLIISKSKTSSLKVGNLYEDYKFKKGFYVYIGSAMNSLIPRIKRHLLEDKKMHWHIDYLLKDPHTTVRNILFTDSHDIIECRLSKAIADDGYEIANFGCSDCSCNSHLIYFERKKEALESVKKAYDEINIDYYDLKYFRKIIKKEEDLKTKKRKKKVKQ